MITVLVVILGIYFDQGCRGTPILTARPGPGPARGVWAGPPPGRHPRGPARAGPSSARAGPGRGPAHGCGRPAAQL